MANPTRTIGWEQLIPAGWDPFKDLKALNLDTLKDNDPKAEEALQSAQELQAEAESQLVAINGELDKLSRELTFARTAYKNSRDDLRRLFDEKRSEQDKINKALAERKAFAQQRLTQLDGELKQLKHQHQLWLEEQKEQALEARMEKQAYWQEVIGALDNQLGQIKATIDARRDSAKAEQKACETWYKNELKSRGVDEDNILKLKQQIRELETKISRAEQRRSEVLRFLYERHAKKAA